VDGDFLTHGTVAGLGVELPEVGLDEMQQQHADTQQSDDDDRSLRRAELFTLERVTHADVPTYEYTPRHFIDVKTFQEKNFNVKKRGRSKKNVDKR